MRANQLVLVSACYNPQNILHYFISVLYKEAVLSVEVISIVTLGALYSVICGEIVLHTGPLHALLRTSSLPHSVQIGLGQTTMQTTH